MKISLEWLKDFVSFSWKPEEFAKHLTMAGIEVEAIENVGDDTILTLAVTPNRGDLLSMVGVAREVSALQGKPLSKKSLATPKGKGAIKDLLQVQLLNPKNCPRYMARAIRGIKIQPLPAWMQKRLESVSLRPINNIVDCTNYVLWELGHPLHAFDYRFLQGKKIIVETSKERTRFKTLDGQTHVCEEGDLFILDGEGPIALAGIMGGANSEVREDTTDIVLEAAYFLPERIHETSKRLRLSSESSYRFERGIDPNGVERALQRVTELIIETAGGVPTADWIDIYPKKIVPKKLRLEQKEIQRILGVEIPKSVSMKIFSGLGFSPKQKGSSVEVSIPAFRFDILQPIDLIEELARIQGFDKIPATLPEIPMGLVSRPRQTCAEAITMEVLTGAGFFETRHLSFTSLEKATLFDAKEDSLVFLENPLSEEDKVLRPTLLPGLLKSLSFNLNRQTKDVALFELSKVFHWKGDEAVERKNLAVVVSGHQWEAQWQMKPKAYDFYALKGLLTLLTKTLHIDEIQFVPEALQPFLFPIGSSSLHFQGSQIGWLGQLSPQVLKSWEIEGNVFALELHWEPLSEASGEVMLHFQKLSKFPFIERDLALVVEEHLPAQRVLEAIQREKNPWMQKVQLFDLFRGANLVKNKKSLAFNIRYASFERTLTNEEVNEAHQELISRLEKELSAQLRK